MRLIVKIEALEENRITCACRIPRDFPWAGSAALPAYMAVEGVAQAAGRLAAAGTSAESMPEDRTFGPRHGYVARIREATFFPTDLDPQASWTAIAEVVGRSGRLVLCRGEAWQAGTQLLQTRFALYLEDSGQSG
jgi:hypothetical protein